jgi:hypothetical protein
VIPRRTLPKDRVAGETLRSCVTVAATLTVADALFVVSATLFAVTVYVPAVLGAVYNPEEETVPPVADQVTEALLLPETVAENCCVVPKAREIEFGLIETETAGWEDVTVIEAEAVLELSAKLVAVTEYVPGIEGAVYKPAWLIEPPLADQLTDVFGAPVTFAENC